MKFVHLHTHSHYSLLDGLAKIDELLFRCKELGMDALALTDHGVMYGAIEFYQKAKKFGIKPIIGSEFYIAPNGMRNKRPNIDDKRYHLILLAKNEIGYKNLLKLTTLAHLEGFYYKPRIDKELLKKHGNGLIGLSACLNGEISRLILSGNHKEAEKSAIEYQEILGKGNFYLEIQHHPKLKEQQTVNKEMLKISQSIDIPLIATNDIHYLKPEDAEAQDILMAVQTGNRVDQEDRLTMKEIDSSMKSPEEMSEMFKESPEAVENAAKIAEKCNLEIEIGKIKLPRFEVPDNKPPEEYLKELCYRGLPKRYPNSTKEILDRLEYELSVIKKTGFAPYFLIVYDFVNWAKSNKIVTGPGRGSAAGSIVSYLLNVTNIDPLKYNLLFERFLNPERISMPDIDLDFADTRRDEVIEYVAQKYGKNNVAQIITFGTMAARAAIRDAGRALGYAYTFCDQIAKMIPFGDTLEKALARVPELKQAYDTDVQAKKLLESAKKLEGVARHASTHACGVVITQEDIVNYTPLQYASQDDKIIVSQYEMHAIEDLGLLKMDFLGLANLSIIEDALNIIKRTQNIEINIDEIPLEDERTFELLRRADTIGVFQLESSGMKRYLKQLKPTGLEDIIAMVSLYRPGPIDLIPDFIDRKHGRKKISYLHPTLEPILKNTYGVAVYQEQVMQMARDLAGFSLSEADILRKAVGKKIKKLLDEQRDKLINGMVTNKIPEETAKKIWDYIEPFARYGFNRSHAACYALIGYQTAYLKAHYPVEFMASLLTSEQDDIERIAELIKETQKMGIKILPPDINESYKNFTVIISEPPAIRFGLAAIKNVGHNVVKAITAERKLNGEFKSIEDFIARVENKDLNKKSLESLIKGGALDKFGERGQLLHNVEEFLKYSRSLQKAKTSRQANLFDIMPASQNFTAFKMKDASPVSNEEKLSWEKELLGLYISSHPTEKFQGKLEKIAVPIKKLTASIGRRIVIGGVVNQIKKIITKNGKSMLFVKIEDKTDNAEIIVFPDTLEKNPFIWQENKVILVSGKVNDKDGVPKLICEKAKELS